MAIYDRLQYMACTVLGYSMVEYRKMTVYEIMRQIEIGTQMAGHGQTVDNVDEDGVRF